MDQTHLMPPASPTESMEWGTAVQVIDWCVSEMLDKIAEWPEDYDLYLRADAAGMKMGKPEAILLRWREHERQGELDDCVREALQSCDAPARRRVVCRLRQRDGETLPGQLCRYQVLQLGADLQG